MQRIIFCSLIFLSFITFAGNSLNKNNSELIKQLTSKILKINNQNQIKVYIANDPNSRSRGFSGVKDSEFPDDEGLLFLFKNKGTRFFWMPDTYFDLLLVYLSDQLEIIDLEILKHYEGRNNYNEIPRGKKVKCHHVLEIKAKSKFADKFQIGMKLEII